MTFSTKRMMSAITLLALGIGALFSMWRETRPTAFWSYEHSAVVVIPLFFGPTFLIGAGILLFLIQRLSTVAVVAAVIGLLGAIIQYLVYVEQFYRT
jgi:lipid-A-disaccharide synthase-like uncharacterized protein